MRQLGHNERSYRLDALAEEAREGLAKVQQGEEYTIGGWLAYGCALNEGRALFPSDEQFGQWIDQNGLRQVAGHDGTLRDVEDHERKAAMWAAENADQFDEARQRGNPRTIRGIHAKWKEIEAERSEEERKRVAAEAQGPAPKAKPDQETPPEHAGAVHDADASMTGASGGGGDSAAPAPEPDEAITGAEPEPEPDPYGYARLTEEALLDTANGLRADLEDERARRKAAEAERDRLASEIKTTLAGSDLGPAVSKLQTQVANIKGKRDDLQAANARQQRRINAQEAEIKRLRREIEAQEIPL